MDSTLVEAGLPTPVTSLLSDRAIMRLRHEGKIVIEPFVRDNLATSSYDVTLGPYYYREKHPEPGLGLYNPYSKEHVLRVWGELHIAERAGDFMARVSVELENISTDDKIIFIQPVLSLSAVHQGYF